MIDRQVVSQYLGPMTLVTKRRMFLASLASAIALFVVPFILVSMEMPYSRPDGTPDNAPLRATAILVLISPVIFVLFSFVTFVLAVFLQHLGQLKPKVLASIVVVASVGLGFVMVLDRPFGLFDALYYFAGFSVLVLATLRVAVFVWWKVAIRPNVAVKIAPVGR